MRPLRLSGLLALLAACLVAAMASSPAAPAVVAPTGCASAIPNDEDCDEVPDGSDNCPRIANPAQGNADETYTTTEPEPADGTSPPYPAGDPQGDACDDDNDADGLLDRQDNCPLVRNPSQRDSNGDGRGDDCPPRDSDGDGAYDDADNCSYTLNEDQADLDNDGVGDACDYDRDGDAVLDSNDNCPTVPNNRQEDRDRDGAGAACDPGDATAAPDEGTPPATSSDRRPPRASASVAARQRARDLGSGLPVAVRCDEACGVAATIELRSSDARRLRLPRQLASGRAVLGGPGRTYVFLRARRSVAGRLGRVPRRGVGATIRARVIDEAGNDRWVRRAVRLTG